MANVKISQLPAASTLTGAELVPIVQGGVTVQTAVDTLTVKSVTQDGTLAALIRRGANGASFASALSAAANVIVEPGGYTNTTTALSVPFGKLIEFRPGATLTSSGSGSFANVGAVARYNYNPSGITGWNSSGVGKYNVEGFSVDWGGYGNREHGGANVVALSGSVSAPSNAVHTQTVGVWGSARTASTTTLAVGCYFFGRIAANNCSAWGGNANVHDDGFIGTQLWGWEVDVNVTNAATAALGVDVTGASTTAGSGSAAFRAGALGVFASPKIEWTKGFVAVDGSCGVAFEAGTDTESANSDSQPIDWYYRDVSNNRLLSARAYSAVGNFRIAAQQNDTLLKLQAKTGGTLQTNLTCYQDMVGIGTDGPVRRLTVDAGAGDIAALLKSAAGNAYIGFADVGSSNQTGTSVRVGSSANDFIIQAGGTTTRLTVSSTLITATLPVVYPSYTVATVPAANIGAGQNIYVSNESGGAVPAFSDNTNWRRYTDRAIIS